jgi:CHAD domain-containing protein
VADDTKATHPSRLKRKHVKRTPVRDAADPANPLTSPAGTVIHDHALRLVQEADLAITRLPDVNDSEALHDARVALRRLRGWLRAFNDHLPLKRKQRQRLGDLSHSSNLARDAEVCLLWLAAQHPKMGSQALSGARQLSLRLTKLRDESQAKVRAELPAEWQKLSRKLKRALSAPPKNDDDSFLQAYTEALKIYVDECLQACVTARSEPVAHNIHRLRIAGKRVRYLVEVIVNWHPQAGDLLRELKDLQNQTGEVQDLQRLIELFEESFKGTVEARYGKVLRAYADPTIHEHALPHARHTQDLSSWLRLARTLGQARADCVEHFRRNYLVPGKRTCMPAMKALLADLQRQEKIASP